MRQGRRLTEAERADLRRWIRGGETYARAAVGAVVHDRRPRLLQEPRVDLAGRVAMAARFLEPCGTEQRVGTERTVERGGLRIRIEGGRRVLGALARMRQPVEGLLAEIPGGWSCREVLAVHRGCARRVALTGQSVRTVPIGEPSGRGPRVAPGDGR